MDELEIALEREKIEAENTRHEKRLRLEIEKFEKEHAFRGFATSPLLLAIVAGILGLFANAIENYYSNRGQQTIEKDKSVASIELEREKFQSNIIIEALKTGGDEGISEENLRLLVEGQLVKNYQEGLETYLANLEERNRKRQLEGKDPVGPSIAASTGGSRDFRVYQRDTDINTRFFFDTVNSTLFERSIAPEQIVGLSLILKYWSNAHGDKDDRYLAYILATIHHETNATFEPVLGEVGPDIEDQEPIRARILWNPEPGDGEKYRSRGFFGLEGKYRYSDFSERLGVDLVNDPDLAMVPEIAIAIAVKGMIAGAFTGKRLEDFFYRGRQDWEGARLIIGGRGHDALIASHARRYYAAISY